MRSRNMFKLRLYLPVTRCIFTSVRRQSVWTADRRVKSPHRDIQLPNCTVNEYIWQNLERWPEKTALVCADSGRGYTYEQVFRLSKIFAASLRNKFRILDGDVVAMMLPNIPDFSIVALGILEAGGVITTLNPVYTSEEMQRQLLQSNAKLIVTITEICNVAKDALKGVKLNIPIIAVSTNEDTAPETVSFKDVIEDINIDKSCLKDVRRNPDDVCFMPYSSGTTGLPKGVELTHKNIVANFEQMNEPAIKCHNETTANHQDSVLAVLPFFHIYGASLLMFHKMSHGVKLVTMAKFQPDLFLESIEKSKTNILFAAPPLILLMTSHPAASPKTFQSLETVINGAAPLAASDGERFLQKVERKIDFRQGYGLTETSPVVALTARDTDNFSCVGHAVPSTELKIVDEQLKNLGPGEIGEILIRGPQVMKGYKDNPQANSEVFTDDGWFRTGDLAVIDKNGVVTIAGRLKELIKVRGFQVPPAELEGILREHPAVNDAAVIGVPHPTNGESPKAFIVLKTGSTAKSEDIRNFVKSRVVSYKRIEQLVFIDSIPRSSAGKILRKNLKDN